MIFSLLFHSSLLTLSVLSIYTEARGGPTQAIINLLLMLYSARVVPENIQKKQARDAKLLAARAAQREAAKKERAEKRKVAAANAEKYAKEYAAEDQALIDSRRKAKAEGNFFVEDQAKIAFVIRTRG